MFVRVEIDDEYEDDRVAQVVLAIPDRDGFSPPFEGIELARDHGGHFLVYDGDPAAEMARVTDSLAQQAITLAEYRRDWSARDEWEEGPGPRRMPGLYDDPDDDGDLDGDEDDLEWTSQR